MPDLKMPAGATMSDMVFHLEKRNAELEAALRAVISLADREYAHPGDTLRLIIRECHKGLSAQ